MHKKYSARGAGWNYGGPHWKLSRSKIDLFTECERCFFLDNRLGIKRPSMPPFNLNVAVDTLLKQEFDVHRANSTPHPIMEAYGLPARPAQRKEIDVWRENFKGITYRHPETNLLVSGAIDDLWILDTGEYAVVDYKATSKDGEITELNDTWHDGYRRQMEVYQWLLRKQGLTVSDTGYFVYCNGRTDRKAFDGKLEFDVRLIAYTGSDSWVEPLLFEIKKALDTDVVPSAHPDCEFCGYREVAGKTLRDIYTQNPNNVTKKVPIKPKRKPRVSIQKNKNDASSLFS